MHHQHVARADAERLELTDELHAVIPQHSDSEVHIMSSLLLLYIVIGVALIVIGVVMVMGQKATENRRKREEQIEPPTRV